MKNLVGKPMFLFGMALLFMLAIGSYMNGYGKEARAKQTLNNCAEKKAKLLSAMNSLRAIIDSHYSSCATSQEALRDITRQQRAYTLMRGTYNQLHILTNSIPTMCSSIELFLDTGKAAATIDYLIILSKHSPLSVADSAITELSATDSPCASIAAIQLAEWKKNHTGDMLFASKDLPALLDGLPKMARPATDCLDNKMPMFNLENKKLFGSLSDDSHNAMSTSQNLLSTMKRTQAALDAMEADLSIGAAFSNYIVINNMISSSMSTTKKTQQVATLKHEAEANLAMARGKLSQCGKTVQETASRDYATKLMAFVASLDESQRTLTECLARIGQ